jgi:hypothetical protein
MNMRLAQSMYNEYAISSLDVNEYAISAVDVQRIYD